MQNQMEKQTKTNRKLGIVCRDILNQNKVSWFVIVYRDMAGVTS